MQSDAESGHFPDSGENHDGASVENIWTIESYEDSEELEEPSSPKEYGSIFLTAKSHNEH